MVGMSIGVSASVNGYYVSCVVGDPWVRAVGAMRGIQARMLVRSRVTSSNLLLPHSRAGQQAGRRKRRIPEARLSVRL